MRDRSDAAMRLSRACALPACSGIIVNPAVAKLMCSYAYDAGLGRMNKYTLSAVNILLQ